MKPINENWKWLLVGAAVMAWTLVPVAAEFRGSWISSLLCKVEETGLQCLREWQTLITGILAGLGAFATVFYLSLQVSQEQQRHKEQIAIATAPERRIVDRVSLEMFYIIWDMSELLDRETVDEAIVKKIENAWKELRAGEYASFVATCDADTRGLLTFHELAITALQKPDIVREVFHRSDQEFYARVVKGMAAVLNRIRMQRGLRPIRGQHDPIPFP